MFTFIPQIPHVQNEIYHLQSQTRSVAWADGKPSLNEAALTEGICLRTLEKGRQSTLTTRSIDPGLIPSLSSQGLEMARLTPSDPHRCFFKASQSIPPVYAIDTQCFSQPLDEIHQMLSELEKKVLAVDPRIKKVVKFHLNERRLLKSITGSNSSPQADEISVTSFAAEILAEQKDQTEVAWDFGARRFSNELKISELVLAVAHHAAESLGGQAIPSGKYAVVVHPRVGAQLLDLMAQALSAEAVQRGRSFLRGQKNQPVASALVNLVDDPTLPGGVASEGFDDEGTPHERLSVVSNGELLDYFYDLRSASVDGRPSNGHGMKESLSALPRPAATNFYMQPGTTPVAEMLASESRVFLLREVMGLHMADPITGEFSLGASGSLYENGRYSRPVRGVTIAGTVASMLKGVSAVGPDLTWMGSTGSSSFLLPSVSIAGN